MTLHPAPTSPSEPSCPTGLEVSCRAVEPFLIVAEERHASLERLSEGLDADPGRLASLKGSISWSDFSLLAERVERLVGGHDGMRDAGTRVMDAPVLRAFAKVVALFADVQRVYKASNDFSRRRLFRCIDSTYEVQGKGRVQMQVTLREPYPVSLPFFTFLAGVFQATPRVVGLPDSVVHMTVEDRTATYVVDHPPSATLWRRITQVFRVLFSARHTLAELELQNQQLLAQLEEVAAARKLAEHSSRMKSEFLANISHELRTPLNPIVSAAEAFEELELDPEYEEHVRMLREGSQKVIRVVDDLLDFSDLDAGGLTLVERSFDLRSSLGLLRAELGALAAPKGLRFELEVADAVPRHVVGDERRLMQIIRNLADNAIKFTESGLVVVSVHARRLEDGRFRVAVEVVDTGPGIPANLQASIFEAFRQQDGSLTRRYGGTGLGLTIAQQLVERMGGELELKSAPGVGSTFRFAVRLRAGSTRERSGPNLAPPEVRAAAAAPKAAKVPITPRAVRKPILAPDRELPWRGWRVLVAEDDRLSARIITRHLEALGCQVDLAQDGSEALEAFESGTYRIVFMDCQMPRMDGLEATRRIRDSVAPKDTTPVVAVTAHAAPGHREECIACGMNDYMTKPVEKVLLEQVLERFANDIGVEGEDLEEEAPAGVS